MKKRLSWLKEHRAIIGRIALFLFLVYVFIPLVLLLITKGKTPITYNFFSFPVYTLILMVLFAVYNRKIFSKYHYRPPVKYIIIYSVFALMIFLLYYFMRFRLYYTETNYPPLLLSSGALYVLCIFFVALAVFGVPLFRRTYISLFVFTLVMYIFYAITFMLEELWYLLAFVVGKLVYYIISLFSSNASFQLGQGDPVLAVDSFKIIIGAPCSGMESISMYLGLFLLLLVYEQKNLHRNRTLVVFFIGLVGTFLLNVLRITLIMLIGTRSPDFALGLFHSQAGWLLFAAFLLVLLYFSYGWMRKKKH